MQIKLVKPNSLAILLKLWACSTVRGYPSKMNPFWISGWLKRFFKSFSYAYDGIKNQKYYTFTDGDYQSNNSKWDFSMRNNNYMKNK